MAYHWRFYHAAIVDLAYTIIAQNTIVTAVINRYIRPMLVNNECLLDILEIAMNACCKRHNFCLSCARIESCVEIWDKASEQSISGDFTTRHLKQYIGEFNRLWESSYVLDEESTKLN